MHSLANKNEDVARSSCWFIDCRFSSLKIKKTGGSSASIISFVFNINRFYLLFPSLSDCCVAVEWA